MGLKDAAVNARWRLAGHRRPLPDAFSAPLAGLRGLEVGGPTDRFKQGGIWPLYPRLASCDAVQWRADTAWHQLDESAPYAPDGAPLGRLVVVESGQLEGLPDSSWDVLMTSHVIEHFANPLAELEAWRRVLVPEGWIALVAPHREGTFDHRRPVTPLEHIVADHAAGTGEDDLTHLDETLALHDRSRDADDSPREQWEAARRDNLNTRLLHHHVFDGGAIVRLLDRAGIQLHHIAVRHPHDTFVLGRFVPEGARPDNAVALAPTAPWRRRSPFAGDRAAG
ncbi:methyltransferase domain-containing protein [Conexibacter sp. JD483]|uniref:methyltransferase domain-containing protein n=1 Tax=unclassified Conexibacter TaxID=2627773 RepID=UPI002717F3C6|nr:MULTISPECIES: methyltransferase domain-containing protein [unclassified Conexibacter]MDO8184056.1 methyltransferase domain-containing protein [Conexibacter sp. CPCC 205706]MDO8197048.1 methyltransferase domain-containing protein [Conexibacter sp. CPCC 205762]MDR9367964.1 methyltransferase domain-containing protein [Conexibacter sp. JD483]